MPLLIEERYIPLACLLPLRHYTTPLETAVKVNTWSSSAKEKKHPSGMIRFMICDMIRDPVRDPVRDRIRNPVRDAIRNPIWSDPSFVWIPVSNCSSLNKKTYLWEAHNTQRRRVNCTQTKRSFMFKKKKRQRQIIKHGDEKEHILITKYMYRSSFKRIFPL